jgi:alpha-N-arabinofuranosidase
MSNTKQSFTVAPNEEIGVISPYLHGQFSEHLGELVYPGLYVGPDSPIPNVGGLRTDVIDALKPLRIPVLRWPGGCFADYYRWRDGIGPKSSRPERINFCWGMASEPNQFGTHEFVDFVRAIGAEPYFAASVGAGSVADMQDWVEYCNFAGSSALADERRANGAPEPFGIKYWGIGNENWGCGGDMSPEEYAGEYARYRAFVRDFSGSEVFAIACGQNGADWQWSRRFLGKMSTDYWDRLGRVNGLAAHYYCGAAGTATQYTESQWLELLAKAYAVDGIVTGVRAVMDSYDPAGRIKLILDEWGAWHPVEEGKPGGGLYQQNTIRDACVAALSLDVFNNHADKIYMANIAQLVNVLQSLLLVEGAQCIKTPTYHAFDLYQPHKGATAVRTFSNSETVTEGEASKETCKQQYLDHRTLELKAVHGSASVKDSVLCVTLVNTHPSAAASVDLNLKSSSFATSELELVTLASGDIHDHNTFASPDKVHLSAPSKIAAKGSSAPVEIPAGGIIRVMGRIG